MHERNALSLALIAIFAVLATPTYAADDPWTKSYSLPASEITALAVYNGELYAAGGNLIYVCGRSSCGTKWDSYHNVEVDGTVYALTVYDNKLYAGTNTGVIHSYDGTSWTASPRQQTSFIRSFAEYRGKLYAGDQPEGKIYVYDGTGWSTSYDTPALAVNALAVYRDRLYAGVDRSRKIYVYDGTSWNASSANNEDDIESLAVYRDRLYAGTSGGVIYVYNGTDWSASYDTHEYDVHSLTVYRDRLYAGTGQFQVAIYVYDGTSWRASYEKPRTDAYALAVYNDRLYAGTGNSTWGKGTTGVLYELDVPSPTPTPVPTFTSTAGVVVTDTKKGETRTSSLWEKLVNFLMGLFGK